MEADMKNMKNKLYGFTLLLFINFLFSNVAANPFYFKIRNEMPGNTWIRTQMSDIGDIKFQSYQEADRLVIRITDGSEGPSYGLNIIYKDPNCMGEQDGCLIMKTKGNWNWAVEGNLCAKVWESEARNTIFVDLKSSCKPTDKILKWSGKVPVHARD